MSTPNLPKTEPHQGPVTHQTQKKRPVLIIVYPATKAIELPPRGETVGRQWLLDVGAKDSQVSSSHLVFDRSRGGSSAVRVSDAGSSNGTWVNGRRLESGERCVLRDQDVLRIGTTVMVFRERFSGALDPSAPWNLVSMKFSGGARGGRPLRRSTAMVAPYGLRKLLRDIEAIPVSARAVLIEGETGAGKELVARRVAEAMGRGDKYTVVNVAAISSGTFESEMFGHVKGAYTGATENKEGILRSSDGGAVFLDEIGELAPEHQVKLLRVIENGEVLPVGASRPKPIDVKIIVATNRSLEQMVDDNEFRHDLLARFHVREQLPPLRERREDIMAILRNLAENSDIEVDWDAVPVESIERILLATWPENVRGLDALLFEGARRQAGRDDGPLAFGVVRRFIEKREREKKSETPVSAEPLTKARVEEALAANKGNVAATSRTLGLSRQSLYRRMDQFGIPHKRG